MILVAASENSVVDDNVALNVDSKAAAKASNAVVEDLAQVQRHVRNNTVRKRSG